MTEVSAGWRGCKQQRSADAGEARAAVRDPAVPGRRRSGRTGTRHRGGWSRRRRPGSGGRRAFGHPHDQPVGRGGVPYGVVGAAGDLVGNVGLDPGHCPVEFGHRLRHTRSWPVGRRSLVGLGAEQQAVRPQDGAGPETSRRRAATSRTYCRVGSGPTASPGRCCAGGCSGRPNATGSGRPTSVSSRPARVGSGGSARSSTTPPSTASPPR